LRPGDVIIVDTLSSQKNTTAAQAMRAVGARFLFLPPYRRDLSPIEITFAMLKGLARRATPRTYIDLWRVAGHVCDHFTEEESTNFFKAAGYETDPTQSALHVRRMAQRRAGREVDVAMSGARVEDYYDANTRRFLLVGGSGTALAIHRPLWGEGVATAEAAAGHVNDIIRDLAERHLGRAPAQVCDLGCGVGGTLFHLAPLWPGAALAGITISATQRDRAEREAHRRGLAPRCRFVQADFTENPEQGQPPADVVIAIESHVHAASAAQFLSGAARFLRPGGLLMIVDDMLVRPETAMPAAERHRLAAFREGWRLGHVPDRDGILTSATDAGFDVLETLDLTPLIRLDRLRDRMLHVAGPLAHRLTLNRWPIFGNMIGGDALTRLYRMGAMRYTCLTLRRRTA
jgi:SAM-dependent methyltransferase